MRAAFFIFFIFMSGLSHGASEPERLFCETRLTSRAPFVFAAVASAAMHAGLIYVIATSPSTENLGNGGASDISIEVVLVDSSALESRQSTPEIATGTMASVHTFEGQSEPPTPTQAQPVAQPEAAKIEEPPPEVISELPPPEPPKVQAKPQESSPATGGAAIREERSAPPKAGATAASPGAMQAYAREVSLALARSKPRGTKLKGSAVIVFTLGLKGEVTSARIAGSSGHPALDTAAINAIQSAKFPPPPPNSTDAQRSFKIPYHFR